MTTIKHDYMKIENQSVIKLVFEFEENFDKLHIVINDNDILASSTGIIKNNCVDTNSTKVLELFITPDAEEINISIDFFKNGININSENIHKTISKLKKDLHPYSPVVFTSKKNIDSFKKRIENKILSDWSATIELKEDMMIFISGKKRDILVCLGTPGEEIQSTDIVFTIYTETDTVLIPKELFSRFIDKKVALYILVRPDFQKSIKNLYYKSRISNEIEIIQPEIAIKNIKDYLNPINKILNPLEWVINYETQLPHLVKNNA
jgi:hypothetical protein